MTYCTGGIIFRKGNRRVHAFTSSSNLVVVNAGPADILIVGGGGGGGYNGDKGSGGGGAGGLIFKPNHSLTAATKAVVIGAGGNGGSSRTNGADSTFDGLTAKGGGAGGGEGSTGDSGNPGVDGGSGGGAGKNSAPGAATQPSQAGDSGTYGKGFAGGTLGAGSVNSGGGGAGVVGSGDGTNPYGGDGLCSVTISSIVYNFASIFGFSYGEVSGSDVYFAGGGAAGHIFTKSGGGLGGGGDALYPNGYPGDANTGGGGGGSGNSYTTSGNGGSGIVLVSYDYYPGKKNTIFDSCIGYWDMKKNALDVMSANNGTVNGATLTTNRLNQTNGAYSFNGSSDKISKTSPIGVSNASYTYNAWVKTNSIGQYQSIIAIGDSATGDQCMAIHSNGKIFGISYRTGGNDTIIGNTTLEADTYYMITLTRNSSSALNLYLNGVSDASPVNVGHATATYGTPELLVGYRQGWYYFNGIIDEAIIFNKDLSADEVKSLYDLSKNKVVYPLVKGWRD